MELEIYDNRFVNLASRLEALNVDDYIDIPTDIESSLPSQKWLHYGTRVEIDGILFSSFLIKITNFWR
jgi:hypothetical protein